MSNSDNSPTLRLEELAEAASVSPRTVRFYTAEGLLPPPNARGRFALYTEEHVRRLRLIARLKEAFLPLEIIREKINTLTEAEIDALLVGASAPPARYAPASSLPNIVAESKTSAAQYLDGVLNRQPRPPAVSPFVSPSAPVIENWKRITLAPGVELHCRAITPFVQQLLSFARTLKIS